MMKDSPLKEKSYRFAIRIVRLVQYLQKEKKEFIISNQVLRSGTNPGAMVCEAEFGQSRPDFSSKLAIGLKEANESSYWLRLLHDTDYINDKMFESIHNDCTEIIAMLVASVKTSSAKHR
jgi:four helix bundle protein